jgi:hypothetical protein
MRLRVGHLMRLRMGHLYLRVGHLMRLCMGRLVHLSMGHLMRLSMGYLMHLSMGQPMRLCRRLRGPIASGVSNGRTLGKCRGLLCRYSRALKYLWLYVTGLRFRLIGHTGGFFGGAS